MAITLRDGNGILQTVPHGFMRVAGSPLLRPANETAYSRFDSVANDPMANAVTANAVSIADIDDAPFTVDAVTLETDDTGPGAVEASFEMHLFRSDPTLEDGVGEGDNSAWSQKRAGWAGVLVGSFRAFRDGSVARLVAASGDARVIVAPGSGGKIMWWQLRTLSDWTPSAPNTIFTPTFEGFFGRV